MNSFLVAGASIAGILLVSTQAGHARASSSPADTVRVRVFELVDDRGQVRTRINVEQDGEVVFRMIDQAGTIRVKLGAGRDGSGMVLLNDRTEPGIHMLSKAAGSSVRVVNPDGKERLLAP